MKLILIEDVEKLGAAGELVEVKPGYGRNYLLPRQLAVAASQKNVRELDHQKAVAATRAIKLKSGAETIAKKLAETPVTLKRKVGEQKSGEQAKLYGSVTALDIAEALAARGIAIDRRTIELAEPLKALGEVEVLVRLHRDVAGKVKVRIEGER